MRMAARLVEAGMRPMAVAVARMCHDGNCQKWRNELGAVVARAAWKLHSGLQRLSAEVLDLDRR